MTTPLCQLALPDGSIVDLNAPGIRVDVDFGLRSWPNYDTGFMEFEHTGYNRLTVLIGGKRYRCGFIGAASIEQGVIRPNYDDEALKLYTEC